MDFDKSIFDTVNHNTTVIINDVSYQGFGTGKANDGLLSSQLNHNFPFDPEISRGAPHRWLSKPLRVQRGGYRPLQTLHFACNGVHFSKFHNISFDKPTGLHGTFTTRDFPIEAFPGTRAVQDLVETFIPSGPGLTKSVMAVDWKGDTGNLSAAIESKYYLSHNEELPALHRRHVTSNTDKSDKGVYLQSEKITVPRTLFSVSSAESSRIRARCGSRWSLRAVASSTKRLRALGSQDAGIAAR